MGRNESGHPPILDYDEAATSGSKHVVVDKILQGQVTLHCRAVVVHDVSDAPVPKSCDQLYLNVAGTGGVEQEPTDEGQPQSAEVCSHEEAKQSQQDKNEGHGLAYLSCLSGRPVGIVSDPPDYGTKDTPTVEGIPGNHVERCQRDVDITEPHQHRDDRGGGLGTRYPTTQPSCSQKNKTNCDTRNGTSDRDREFGLGVRGFRLDLRHTAQSKQGNATNA